MEICRLKLTENRLIFDAMIENLNLQAQEEKLSNLK